MAELPSFFVRADPIVPDEWAIERSLRNFEIPPRRPEANLIDPSGAFLLPGRAWYFSGQANHTAPQGFQQTPVPLPPHILNSTPQQCYTVYVMEGDMIFTVPFDATRQLVHDGRAPGILGTEFNDSTGLPNDWERLQFRAAQHGSRLHSYAEHNAGSHVLQAWPGSAVWYEQLLPTSCRVGVRRPNRGGGGLVGDVSLLIALVILSIPTTHVAAFLPRLITSTYMCLPRDRCPAELYRQRHRGVVVKLWADIGDPQPYVAEGLAGVTRYRSLFNDWLGMFNRYQNGELGVMFPPG